jgi:hypothetical protein
MFPGTKIKDIKAKLSFEEELSEYFEMSFSLQKVDNMLGLG